MLEKIQDPCLGGRGGGTRSHFYLLEGYSRAHLVGLVGYLLANIQEIGSPWSNVEGGLGKIPRPMSWWGCRMGNSGAI